MEVVKKSRTIKVSQSVWKYLNQIKLDENYGSIDSAIKLLILEHKDKNEKTN